MKKIMKNVLGKYFHQIDQIQPLHMVINQIDFIDAFP